MNESIEIRYWKSPVGELILGTFENKLCLCDWRYRKMRDKVDQRVKSFFKAEFVSQENELHLQAIQELKEYFEGKREVFSIPLLFAGSDFQKKVWNLLLEIPFGKTSSYLDLSKSYGDARAIRAVASANGANAISIMVPCHRIIGKSGDLVGYAGGLPAKRKLLQLENVNIGGQTQLF